jgi:hypothetical protein
MPLFWRAHTEAHTGKRQSKEGGVNKLLKKEVKSDASPFGELTQRLIQLKGG